MPQFPPLAAFPSLALHESVSRDDVDAPSIVNKWLSQLSQFCVQGHLDDLSTLFVEESWWRDLLGLSWDFASKHGPESIGKYISSSQAEFGHIKAVEQGALQAQLVDMGPLTLIQSGFTFKTKFGYGRGVVKLANVSPQEWKAWCVFTRLDRLATQDEPGIQKAPESQIHKNRPGRVNVDSKSKKEPLQVLIIGAGLLASYQIPRAMNYRLTIVFRSIWARCCSSPAAPWHSLLSCGQSLSTRSVLEV